MNNSYWSIDLLLEEYEPVQVQNKQIIENMQNSDLFSSLRGYNPRKLKM